MKLHRKASRLITAVLTLVVGLVLAGTAFAQVADDWTPGSKTLPFRHTSSTGKSRIFNAAGTQTSQYDDSLWIGHAFQLTRVDTSVVFTGGDDGFLQDWTPVRPQAALAGDSLWIFTVCVEAATSNGASTAITTAFGDSIGYVLQASYDGGGSWKTVLTQAPSDGSVLNAIQHPYTNLIYGGTYPIATISRLNFWIQGQPLCRILTTSGQSDWNGFAKYVIRYPHRVRSLIGG